MSRKTNITKKRNWAFVLYSDSAPSNWEEIISSTGIEWARSPYHDMDLNPTGEIKKAHYHIILSYSGPTTFNNVSSLVTGLLNQPMPIPLDSVKGYYRYFTHKDNPEKYQYKDSDIRLYNGFDLTNILNNHDINIILTNIYLLIEENNILEWQDLILFLLSNEDLQEFLFVANQKSYTINLFINSKRNKLKRRSR